MSQFCPQITNIFALIRKNQERIKKERKNRKKITATATAKSQKK